MTGRRTALPSEARPADDLARAGVDVDPDDALAAQELEAVAADVGIIFGAEIGEAAHLRDDSGLDRAQRDDSAVAGALERFRLLALARSRRRRGGQQGGHAEQGDEEGGGGTHEMDTALAVVGLA